ncbi:hypothetical protein NG799_21920 [Laspinema sp. D1]|uniref:Uncharacterized protein n=1 Tax=Laspinema palackyanum D2a TaxID=2953684 RepID=A0ABT2MW81_9CYAN|nr:hypothetical protein [Laspinema sp. D2a]
MGRGRPGGNPELKEHSYTTKRPEPLLAKLSMRIESSVMEKLKDDETWQEDVREAIARVLHSRGELSEDLKQYYGLE